MRYAGPITIDARRLAPPGGAASREIGRYTIVSENPVSPERLEEIRCDSERIARETAAPKWDMRFGQLKPLA